VNPDPDPGSPKMTQKRDEERLGILCGELESFPKFVPLACKFKKIKWRFVNKFAFSSIVLKNTK
jgi:hypothetical protein